MTKFLEQFPRWALLVLAAAGTVLAFDAWRDVQVTTVNNTQAIGAVSQVLTNQQGLIEVIGKEIGEEKALNKEQGEDLKELQTRVEVLYERWKIKGVGSHSQSEEEPVGG